MNVIYTGELVRLRPFRDLAEWTALQREYEFFMSPFWGPWNWPEAKQARAFEEAGGLAVDKHTSFAIERLDTGECIGIEEHGGLSAGGLATWLGTCIAGKHHSRGFGREAKLLMLCHLFENFPLHSVYADTTGEHRRAQAGLEAVGMRQVGTYRACHWRAGNLVDVPLYQVMREEWEGLPIRGIVKRGSRT